MTDNRNQVHDDTQSRFVPVADSPPPDASLQTSNTKSVSRRAADALLGIWADTLSDIEAMRMALESRIRALHKDGAEPGDIDEKALVWHLQTIIATEHDVTLDLQRAMRKHPLGPWIKATAGVGEKQGARLIASIGDPYWNLYEDRPRRGPAELWAYCGYHVLHPGQNPSDTQKLLAGVDPSDTANHPTPDPHGRPVGGVAPRRQRGQHANWNPDAKARAFLAAESAVKAGVRKLDACDDTDGYDLDNRKAITPLGQTYLDGRTKYADAGHNSACHRCGPAGHPAQPGSPLSAGHQHARALRLVAKQILKDLWVEAKRLHDVAP